MGEPDGTRSIARRAEMGKDALFVSAMRFPAPPVDTLVWLRLHSIRDSDVHEILRKGYRITRREFQLIDLVRRGYRNREIGARLGLTAGTVAQYLSAVFQKLGVHSRAELIAELDRLRHVTSGRE